MAVRDSHLSSTCMQMPPTVTLQSAHRRAPEELSMRQLSPDNRMRGGASGFLRTSLIMARSRYEALTNFNRYQGAAARRSPYFPHWGQSFQARERPKLGPLGRTSSTRAVRWGVPRNGHTLINGLRIVARNAATRTMRGRFLQPAPHPKRPR